MAKNTLTEKQIEFCKLISSGKSGAEAYRIAFNNASSGTCKVNGSKLLKQPLIAEKIKELKSIAKSITEAAQRKSADKIAADEIATVAERMKILTQIMRGEIPLKKPMVVSMGAGGGSEIQEIETVPDWMDRKNAIAELNKMDGSYASEKQDVTVRGVKSITIEPISKNKG